MTIRLPASVISFAAGDTSLYVNFVDYWNHYRSENGSKKFSYVAGLSLAEKEEALNAALLREIEKKSGVSFASMPIEQAITHPMVAWAAGNISSQMISALLPDTVINSTGAYAEVRVLGLGESAQFKIGSRDLFPVSKAGRLGMREAEMHKGFEGEVTLVPETRQMTVGVSLFRVLTGQESLAAFTVKCLQSLETAMQKDIYDVFAAGFLALTINSTTGLRETGYSQAGLTRLAQRVSAYNGGAKPIVMGTKLALASVMPEDSNYRYDVESSFVKLGYVRELAGVTTFEIPQVAEWSNPFATSIADDKLYIVAPGTDKIVKVVLGGITMSNVSGAFDAATLTQNATFWQSWKAAICTSSIGACITL